VRVPRATRHLAEGEEGFDFLGFHHRLVRGRTPKSAHLTFLARWPARKAVQRARDRIREITGRKWLWMPVEDIVRTSTCSCAVGLDTSATATPPGSSARSGTTPPAARDLAVQEGQPPASLAMGPQATAPVAKPDGPDQPRWNRRCAQTPPGLAWEDRMPPVNSVGEPCAGEPHARFDGRDWKRTVPHETAPVPDPPTCLTRWVPARWPRTVWVVEVLEVGDLTGAGHGHCPASGRRRAAR
jgi:hypothetical protein